MDAWLNLDTTMLHAIPAPLTTTTTMTVSQFLSILSYPHSIHTDVSSEDQLRIIFTNASKANPNTRQDDYYYDYTDNDEIEYDHDYHDYYYYDYADYHYHYYAHYHKRRLLLLP